MRRQGASASGHRMLPLLWTSLLSLLGHRADAECNFFCKEWCDESVLFCHRLECNPADANDCPGSTCEEECGGPTSVGRVAREEPSESSSSLVKVVAVFAGMACCLGACFWRAHHGRCRIFQERDWAARSNSDLWLGDLEAGRETREKQHRLTHVLSSEHDARDKEGDSAITHEPDRQARRGEGSRSPSPKPSISGDGAQGQKVADDCGSSDAGSTRSGRSVSSSTSRRKRPNSRRNRRHRASDGGDAADGAEHSGAMSPGASGSPRSFGSPASSRSHSPRGRSPRGSGVSRRERNEGPRGGSAPAAVTASPASSRASSKEGSAAAGGAGGGGRKRGHSRSRRSARKEAAPTGSSGTSSGGGPSSAGKSEVAPSAASSALLGSMLRWAPPDGREAADVVGEVSRGGPLARKTPHEAVEAEGDDPIIFRPGMLAPAAPPQPSEEDMGVSEGNLTQEGQHCLDEVLQAIELGSAGRHVGARSKA